MFENRPSSGIFRSGWSCGGNHHPCGQEGSGHGTDQQDRQRCGDGVETWCLAALQTAAAGDWTVPQCHCGRTAQVDWPGWSGAAQTIGGRLFNMRTVQLLRHGFLHNSRVHWNVFWGFSQLTTFDRVFNRRFCPLPEDNGLEGVAGDRLCRLVRRVAAWLHRPVAHAAAQDSGPVEAKDDSGCWSSKWTNGYTVPKWPY